MTINPNYITQHISPQVLQNGEDLFFSILILIFCIAIIILFAIILCGWAFRVEPFLLKIEPFDTLRIAMGIGFFFFTMYFGGLVFSVDEIGSKFQILGLELAVLGIGFNFIFSAYSDIKKRTTEHNQSEGRN